MTIDPTKFEAQGLPTREQARAVWDSLPRASARKCEAEMKKRGWDVSWRTLARWHADGWIEKAPNKISKRGEPSAIKAVKAVHSASVSKRKHADRLDAAVATSSMSDEDLARIEESKAELLQKTIAELRETLEKERLIYNVILLRESMRKANIQALGPAAVSSFVAAFTEDAKAVRPVAEVIGPSDAPGFAGYTNGHANGHMPVIEGKIVSPTTQAIERFLAKENAV